MADVDQLHPLQSYWALFSCLRGAAEKAGFKDADKIAEITKNLNKGKKSANPTNPSAASSNRKAKPKAVKRKGKTKKWSVSHLGPIDIEIILTFSCRSLTAGAEDRCIQCSRITFKYEWSISISWNILWCHAGPCYECCFWWLAASQTSDIPGSLMPDPSWKSCADESAGACKALARTSFNCLIGV